MNGDKMDTDDKERQERDQESSNIGLCKTEYNKHPEAESEQHTFRNKLKEDIQIM